MVIVIRSLTHSCRQRFWLDVDIPLELFEALKIAMTTAVPNRIRSVCAVNQVGIWKGLGAIVILNSIMFQPLTRSRTPRIGHLHHLKRGVF